MLSLFETMLGPITVDYDSDGKDRAKERVLATISQNARRANTVVAGQDIWKLPLVERETITKKWKSEINPYSLLDQTAEIHCRHQIALHVRAQAHSEVDRRCLEQRKFLASSQADFFAIYS